MFSLILRLAEVATGNLLDLADGAKAALVHSGKTQTGSDPFMVHNHTTENNNTVWVRPESDLSASAGCFGSMPDTFCTFCFSCTAAVPSQTIAH